VPAAPSQRLKEAQLQALQMVLPESAEVADMLKAWRGADARYWGGRLRPCWLTAAIEPYGKCLGSWSPGTRTLNLVPQLWHGPAGPDGVPAWVTGVVVHECCHQAQGQLYGHLDRQARGPRGRWTDTSHRCPSWARAVEDVVQAEGLDVFCPVWRRSTGNLWHPWVPVSEDWLQWEQADPEATVDGRKLLSFERARSFTPSVSLEDLVAGLELATVSPSGKPVQWDL
jgi:hypothetical protein